MFRYKIQITSSSSWDFSSTVFLGLSCSMCGAQCRIDRLPKEVVIRSAPIADTILFVLERDECITATADPIAIGIPYRCVGAQTVQLVPVAGSAELCREVNVSWCVEEEDRSVFPNSVEVRVIDKTNQQDSSTATVVPSAVKQKDDMSRGGGSLLSTTPKTSERSTLSELSDSVTPSSTTVRQELMENPFDGGNPNHLGPNKGKAAAGEETEASSLSYLPQCLHGPPHAPEGFIDFYATSTQTVARPKAWANLYTSPSPLVENGKSEEHPADTDMKQYPFNGKHILRRARSSAIDNIIRDPTQSPELRANEEFKEEIHRRVKGPQGRKLISFTATT